MKIKVLYFASLQESANKPNEDMQTDCKTAKELYIELKDKYNFELEVDDLKVAINETYSDFDSELKDGDIIAFIPPIAGGWYQQ